MAQSLGLHRSQSIHLSNLLPDHLMITKAVFNEAFNLIGVNRIEATPSTHKMAKYRKRSPFKLNIPKAILWFVILSMAIGFAFLWYKLIAKLIFMFLE